MLNGVTTVQQMLTLGLGVLVLGMSLFALVDALRARKDAFTAAGKLTKPIWSAILGVGVVIAIIMVFNPLNIFGIVVVVASGVYLADVRPAVRGMSGGGGGTGPYGRW